MDLAGVPAPWRALVAEINGGRILDGEPGIRDVDHPCDVFEPADEPGEYSEGGGTCDTDGHYLCLECVHISTSALRHRRGQCVECGASGRDAEGYCVNECGVPLYVLLRRRAAASAADGEVRCG